MSTKFSMDDYIDVAERIANFTERYPDGSLQTVDWSVETVGDRTFVVYRAAAYRTPGDKRPGHGTAWEPFPGPTPYTKDSELMNAETAAWGRACVAIGILANRKIASKQEVKARQDDKAPTRAAPSPGIEVLTDPIPQYVTLIKAAAHDLTIKQIRGCLESQGLDPTHLDTDPPFRRVPQEKSGALIGALQGIVR